MPQGNAANTFDFSIAPAYRAKGAILAVLDHRGPGHTLYCLSRNARHSPHRGCPSQPALWKAPAGLLEALRALLASGCVDRVGAYHWLRPGRSRGIVVPLRGVVQR